MLETNRKTLKGKIKKEKIKVRKYKNIKGIIINGKSYSENFWVCISRVNPNHDKMVAH
jgi:hypothetical protein